MIGISLVLYWMQIDLNMPSSFSNFNKIE